MASTYYKMVCPLISSASYHALRTSGFLTLPSANVVEAKVGFQPEQLEEEHVRSEGTK